MSIKLNILLFALQLFFLVEYKAQQIYSVGYLPALNLNKKLTKVGSLNFNIQQRNSLYREQGNVFSHEYVLSDLTILYGHKIGLYSKISVGGMMRYRDQELITRTIQQFVKVNELKQFKLANRLRLDQTYSSTKVEYRLRYRFGAQVALNGTKVDSREMYLKVNNEYLTSYINASYDMEIRVIASLGYAINKNNKIELGLDNRFGQLLSNSQKNASWITFAFYFNLK